MDERVTQELSAYLDDELEAEERARVAELLSSSTEARAELERLATARDLLRAGAASPSAAEGAALDAAVLSTHAPATASVNPPRSRRESPRRRGRPPWPYFAAAAAFALVLSLGVVVLAQVFGRGTSRDTAAVTTTTASTPATAAESPQIASAPPRPSGDPAEPGQRQDSGSAAVPVQRNPELYLSGVAAGDASELSALATVAPRLTVGRDEALQDLVDLGSAAGLDRGELTRCLGAAAPGVPVRVDVGSFAGTPAYLVVLAPPGSAATTVVALARGTCTTLATTAAPG